MTIKFLDGAYQGIVCNRCGKEAPSQQELREHHGLSSMGWKVSGGVHLCPDEDHDEPCAPSDPIYETSNG